MKTNGPGRYDDLATEVREKAAAEGVMVIVFGGNKGPGFSAQLPAHILIAVPQILRDVANQIERQMTES
jgi:methylmalonyl-CoA mutase cobalamin-binding subunit